MINPSDLPYDKTAPWYQYHRLMHNAEEGKYVEWYPSVGWVVGWTIKIETPNGQPTSYQWPERPTLPENPKTAFQEEYLGSWELDDPAGWYGAGDEDFH